MEEIDKHSRWRKLQFGAQLRGAWFTATGRVERRAAELKIRFARAGAWGKSPQHSELKAQAYVNRENVVI